ncbi:MAG: methylenetetrahydrofolate--tRNA-(uracil(54)-C(5))-methyltransferase (FADH(2)-oxidizing) TrmFO [Pseudomonadota bacterium]
MRSTGSGPSPSVRIVGGGLAGCEAAWQLAARGVDVELYEMRPTRTTLVHTSPDLAELVCSNSLRSDSPEVAVGLLKRELRALGSLVLAAADHHRVPAGSALAVDRALFAREITRVLEAHPRVTIRREEVRSVPREGPTLLTPGPLVSDALAADLAELLGTDHLSFFDAIAPIVDGSSLDMDRLFAASRWDRGDGDDYLNAPMDAETYRGFVDALLAADRIQPAPFDGDDKIPHFPGCQPVEAIASTGPRALAFGPLKPVGLRPPDGSRPAAVVQLRAEDRARTAFNLVGFQTRLRRPAQEQVFRSIPGLEHARFLRYGSIHRNTFVDAPAVLDGELRLRARPSVRIGGQLSGSEGYVESVATGLLAALFLYGELTGVPLPAPPLETALGGLLNYVTRGTGGRFQPSNMHFGLLPPGLGRRRERRQGTAESAAVALGGWMVALPGSPSPEFSETAPGAPAGI